MFISLFKDELKHHYILTQCGCLFSFLTVIALSLLVKYVLCETYMYQTSDCEVDQKMYTP